MRTVEWFARTKSEIYTAFREMKTKTSLGVRFGFRALTRTLVHGKGLGFDVAFRYREEGDAALPIFACTSQVSTFERKKVLTALEFSGSRAVFNSCKEARQKGGEKILRWDIKWADKIGTNFKLSRWPQVASSQHLKT